MVQVGVGLAPTLLRATARVATEGIDNIDIQDIFILNL